MIEININQVLLRTRGYHWDYLLLLTPTAYNIDSSNGWYDVYRLLEVTQGQPKYLTLTRPDHLKLYVATCAYIDEFRTDEFNRPVVNYICCFSESRDDICRLPSSFAKDIIAQSFEMLNPFFQITMPLETNLDYITQNILEPVKDKSSDFVFRFDENTSNTDIEFIELNIEQQEDEKKKIHSFLGSMSKWVVLLLMFITIAIVLLIMM